MGAGWQSSLCFTDSNLFNEVYGVNFYKMASFESGSGVTPVAPG
jgi:hypothetical protein